MWQTTQDGENFFRYHNDHRPINFTSPGEFHSQKQAHISFPERFPGAIGSVDIKVDDSKLYQQMVGELFSYSYELSCGSLRMALVLP